MKHHLNFCLRPVSAARLVLTLTLACAGAFTVSAGGIISFNVASPTSQNHMYPGDYAGPAAARANNWNNLTADGNGSSDNITLPAGSVMDSSGNTVSGMKVVLHPSGGGVVNYGNSGGTNDPKMFLDYNDCFGCNSFANYGYIDLTNIPYAKYNIYCYAATDNSPSGSLGNARGGFWLVTNAPGGSARCYIKDVDNNGNLVPEPDTSGNGYVQSQTASVPAGSSSWTNVNGGNYVVFNAIFTNSSARIWFGAMGGSGGGVDDLGNTFTDGDGTLRLKVCGFQIVRSLVGLTATNLYLQSPVPVLAPDGNYTATVLANFTDGTVGGNVTTLPGISYASSNTNLISVSTNGVITAGMNTGVATLTIAYQTNTLQVLVTNSIMITMVQTMPNTPTPFLMRNWKQVATNYDSFIFNYSLTGPDLPLILPDNANENFNLPWFALPSYVGFTNYSQPEGINAIAAVLGASLVGIDKSNQNGTNWVLMMSQYCDTAVNVFFNNAFYSGSTGQDFWYSLLPHILFVGLVDHYPAVANVAIPLSHGGGTQTMNGLFYASATNWYNACVQMGAGPNTAPNFNYLGCNWPSAQPFTGGWVEPEGAAGVAWLEYMAWRKFGNTNFLQGADWGMEFMQNSTGNIVYEVLLPYGVLAAARMNAEQGRNYDISKFMNWCFDANGYARQAWGAITGTWGGDDVNGLIGSRQDWGGYAFAMNTFEWAGALAPVARYDQRFGHDLGKWLLNLANSARLFYSTYVPTNQQSSAWWLNGTNDIISYEGLKAWYNDGVTLWNLYATGDATVSVGGVTDFALYGASHVGLLGAIVGSTSDPMILQLDVRATDHFLDASYPTYLYYNPHTTNATFTVNYGTGTNDLLDIVSEHYLATGASGSVSLSLPPDTAAVVVVIPSGAAMIAQGGRLYANGRVVDYRAASDYVSSTSNQTNVLYQEDWGTTHGGSNVSHPTDVGWTQVLGTDFSSGFYQANGAADVTTGAGLPTNSFWFGDSDAGPDLALFYTTNGSGSGIYGDWAFTSINPALFTNLDFSVYAQWNYAGSNLLSWFAVQAGGAWYVSTNHPIIPNQTGGNSFHRTDMIYNPAATNWNNLTVGSSVAIGGPAAAGLSGPITGIGLVAKSTGGWWNVNELQVTGVATVPTTLGGIARGAMIGNSLTLNWPANANVHLQSATNLAPPVVWSDVPNTTGQGSATITTTNTKLFFRLIQP
jgi:hypothetical protein